MRVSLKNVIELEVHKEGGRFDFEKVTVFAILRLDFEDFGINGRLARVCSPLGCLTQ